MKLDEAKQILEENDYKLEMHEANEIKVTPDIDETKCPKCGADGDCYDSDMQDDYVFYYYKCPDCDLKWRVDNKLVPEWIVIGD